MIATAISSRTIVRTAGAIQSGLRAGPVLDHHLMRTLRRQLMLEGCKWDTQVGDVDTLAPFPLVMKRTVWNQLAQQAEQLTAEMMAAELEICRRPELLAKLGLPAALLRVLGANGTLTPSAGRVIRFDFHPTTEGWRISEANSDVPGGFTEGTFFTALMAEHFPAWPTAGNPGAEWTKALATSAGHGGIVALVSAPGYLEDHQVVAYLAQRLREHGCHAHRAGPRQICWQDGIAHLNTPWYRGPVDTIVRFYQAEWLAKLRVATGWTNFFREGKTSVANPAPAVISESKRFPLVWHALETDLPAWRTLLPETREIIDAPWQSDDSWLLKTAYCNTGDTVSIRGLMTTRAWWKTWWRARLQPGKWLAQRRFESVPLDTPLGKRHVCAGVYVVNGKVAGAYTRLAERPVIDFAAVDAALLLEEK